MRILWNLDNSLNLEILAFKLSGNYPRNGKAFNK